MSLKIGQKPASRKGSLSWTTPNAAPESLTAICPEELQSLIKQGVIKQVPSGIIGGKILFGHSDGMFLNAIGRPMPHTLSPSNRTKGKHCFNGKRGNDYPCMRHFGSKSCHLLMALAFYGERRIFVDSRGKSYVGICHHLIPDVLNYRPANLLCWLTREQHAKADARQRALKTVVPDGNLHLFPYERLRELQDPRVTSDEKFLTEINLIRAQGYHRDPGASSQRNGRSGIRLEGYDRMEWDMSHHMET